MKKFRSLVRIVPFVSFMLSSCWVESPCDTGTDKPTAEVSIHTRSVSAETPPLLPVHVYAFSTHSTQGICAGYKVLTDADELLSFVLPAGTYTLYAVAGAATDKYSLPDSASALPGSPVALQFPGMHSELETGRADITLTDGAEEGLTLTVTRIVARVTATLTGTPADVTAVEMSLQPLHTDLCINGTFSDDGLQQLKTGLTKNDDGNWQTADTLFIFPSDAGMTIGFTLTTPDGNRSYSYNMPAGWFANCKYNIVASYREGGRVEGSVSGSDWEGEYLVSFEFGEGATGSTEYAQGDIYRGAFILDVKENEGNSTLVLLSTKQWQTDIEFNFEDDLSYTHNGIQNWEMFSEADAVTFFNLWKDNHEWLNTLFAENSISLVNDTFKYIYKKNGGYKVFSLQCDTFLSEDPQPDVLYRLYRKKELPVQPVIGALPVSGYPDAAPAVSGLYYAYLRGNALGHFGNMRDDTDFASLSLEPFQSVYGYPQSVRVERTEALVNKQGFYFHPVGRKRRKT
jgi:hypothetical protein